jgi:hypothetical protein
VTAWVILRHACWAGWWRRNRAADTPFWCLLPWHLARHHGGRSSVDRPHPPGSCAVCWYLGAAAGVPLLVVPAGQTGCGHSHLVCAWSYCLGVLVAAEDDPADQGERARRALARARGVLAARGLPDPHQGRRPWRW